MPQHKPVIAQLKSAVSAQSVKQPVAPPVYRPQVKPLAAQAKMAGAAQLKTHPAAPPVYRPQALPRVLQTKQAVQMPAQKDQLRSQRVAPPPYRPQPTPKVLQTKTRNMPGKNLPSAARDSLSRTNSTVRPQPGWARATVQLSKEAVSTAPKLNNTITTPTVTLPDSQASASSTTPNVKSTAKPVSPKTQESKTDSKPVEKEDLRLGVGSQRDGVSAKAKLTLKVGDSIKVYESYTHSNGAWNQSNGARYYMDFAKGRASGDAEVKVLSDIANQIMEIWDYNAKSKMTHAGEMILHSTKGPCNSCRGVIRQFGNDHPNVKITVIYGGEKATEKNTDGHGDNGYQQAVNTGLYWQIVL